MEVEGRYFVDRGLRLLRDGLKPYLFQQLNIHLQQQWWEDGVEQHLSKIVHDIKNQFPARDGYTEVDWFEALTTDPYYVLQLLIDNISSKTIYFDKLSQGGISLIHVLQDKRNAWAHFKSDFSLEETRFTLHSVASLLERIGATDEAETTNKLLEELQPETSAPPDVSLEAQPTTIKKGHKAILSWKAENASQVLVHPDMGYVDPEDQGYVSPREETTYTIAAISPSGVATAEQTVKVQPNLIRMFAIPSGIIILGALLGLLLSQPWSGNNPPVPPPTANAATIAAVSKQGEGSCKLNPTVETMLYNALLERQIEVVKSTAEGNGISSQMTCEAAYGNKNAMEKLVTQLDDVQILVLSKVTSDYLGQQNQLHSSRVELNLRALEAGSWEVIASDVFQATEADISQEAAREKALKALGGSAGTYLAEQIAAYKAEQKEADDE